MVIKRKTQIILALIISSVFFFQGCASIFPGTSKRKFPERRQGDLVITKKDGRQIEGELITVKENSLLLLDRYGGDVSIEIRDIRTIRIVKKSKARLWGVIGGAVGFVGGVLIAIIQVKKAEDVNLVFAASISGGLLSLPGYLIGRLAGSHAGIDETIQIEGMTDLQIKWAMDKLRKKARIRDYK